MFKLLMWEVVRVTYDNFKDYMYYLLTSPFKRVKNRLTTGIFCVKCWDPGLTNV